MDKITGVCILTFSGYSFEPPGGRAYLVYQEDISKTNQGGIKHMKKVLKEVHYANQSDSSRCFVHLYKEHLRHCPPDWPDSAFYLTPLKQPKGDIWFSEVPLCFRKSFPD